MVPRSPKSRLLGMAVASLVPLAVAPGCRTYPNAHGRQNQPHVIRITSEPSGATLTLHARDLDLVTPADVRMRGDSDERITIVKEGYVPFEGTLRDLAQISRNTYQAKLRPL